MCQPFENKINTNSFSTTPRNAELRHYHKSHTMILQDLPLSQRTLSTTIHHSTNNPEIIPNIVKLIPTHLANSSTNESNQLYKKSLTCEEMPVIQHKQNKLIFKGNAYKLYLNRKSEIAGNLNKIDMPIEEDKEYPIEEHPPSNKLGEYLHKLKFKLLHTIQHKVQRINNLQNVINCTWSSINEAEKKLQAYQIHKLIPIHKQFHS